MRIYIVSTARNAVTYNTLTTALLAINWHNRTRPNTPIYLRSAVVEDARMAHELI